MIEIEEKAKSELDRIEQKNSYWRNSTMKHLSMWEEIAMQINSYTGKKQEYWCLVMELYHKKYQQSPKPL